MDFENIVISPPDNYRFLNFIPIVIDLYTFEIRKSENLLEVSFNEWLKVASSLCLCIQMLLLNLVVMLSRIAKKSIRFDSDSLVTFLPEVRFDSNSELFWFEKKKVGICPCNACVLYCF